jgi:GH25 family lysozyme M1 (1,4-beta-N-acetylmuramidase)
MLSLIDLSNNNPSPIDFAAVRGHGVYGAWMKVTEGSGFVDVDFHIRAVDARRAGLRVGGYHFARPAESPAVVQAAFFCHHLVSVGRRDLHPVLDLEDAGGLSARALHDWARIFLRTVDRLMGVKAITYSGPAFVTERHWQRTFGTGAGLWLADYGPDDGTDHGPHIPAPWRSIVAHQYTSVGRVPGIEGKVDLSHARARRKILAHGLRGIV